MKTEPQHRIEQLKKATDRIQREIEEVTEREHELRNVGSIKTLSHDFVDSKVRRMPQALSCGRLKRTTSTPQILEPSNPAQAGSYNTPVQTATVTTPLPPKMTNGVISTTRSTPQPLRFANTPSQKGLMHRFLATRGRIYNRSLSCGLSGQDSAPIVAPTITLNPESIKALNRSLEMRSVENGDRERPPTRKGFVPVEKKIQKELTEMRERENELRLMRSKMLAKSQPNLIDIVNDNDSDVYDSAGSLRSGTSTNTLNEDEPDSKDSQKPPRRRSNLIAQWESLIAKEANEKTC